MSARRQIEETTPAADPRLDERWFETLPGDDGTGTLVLVGAVHDHPSTVHRVAETVAGLSPDVLALEVSPLAVGLFERTARHTSDRHEYGEMTAAVRACEDARVVGVDAPSADWCRAFGTYLTTERPSARDAWDVLGGAASIGRHAARYRIAAAAGRLPGVDPTVDPPEPFAVDATDPPAEQARDERRQASRSRSLLAAADLPPAVERLDALRESAMASRLAALRDDGDVVAVIGRSHLDPVRKRLDGTG